MPSCFKRLPALFDLKECLWLRMYIQAHALAVAPSSGTADNFLEVQLKPETFQAAAEQAGFPVTMRMQEGYDHR